MSTPTDYRLAADAVAALVEARHDDPFAVLGPHAAAGGVVIRALVPGAERVEVVEEATGAVVGALERRHDAGLFEGLLADRPAWFGYTLRASNAGGTWEIHDPYRYPPVLGDLDDYLIREGTHRRLWERLGAHAIEHAGVAGVHFAVWAPNAARVSVIGDFNGWDGRRNPMRRRAGVGIWEIFIPGLGEGALYKYELRRRRWSIAAAQGRSPRHRRRAATADGVGGQARGSVHLGRPGLARQPGCRPGGGGADQHPRGPSGLVGARRGQSLPHLRRAWRPVDPLRDRHGLHPSRAAAGQRASVRRLLGLPAGGPVRADQPPRHPPDFARFVDRCHAAGLGLLLDWVPGHFPTDAHGLGQFDGTALYEHADPRQGFHQDWSTLIYNFGRTEVTNFLHANALFWLDRYHIDGLRVDAVASMLYLDYSRKADEWIPNKYGGRENLEAVDFMRRMNELAYGQSPGIMTVAEESTAWPGVSRPTWAAASASATNGTWGGCTTPWNIWARTRRIAAGIITR